MNVLEKAIKNLPVTSIRMEPHVKLSDVLELVKEQGDEPTSKPKPSENKNATPELERKSS